MQSRKLSFGLAAAGIAVAVVLFIVLSDDDGSDSGSTTTAGRTTTTTGGPPKRTTTAPAPPKIAFRNGAPVGGVQEIEVEKGDAIRFDVTPDVAAEVHVHGYELTEEVKAGGTARLDFPATLEGVFEVELASPCRR